MEEIKNINEFNTITQKYDLTSNINLYIKFPENIDQIINNFLSNIPEKTRKIYSNENSNKYIDICEEYTLYIFFVNLLLFYIFLLNC